MTHLIVGGDPILTDTLFKMSHMPSPSLVTSPSSSSLSGSSVSHNDLIVPSSSSSSTSPPSQSISCSATTTAEKRKRDDSNDRHHHGPCTTVRKLSLPTLPSPYPASVSSPSSSLLSLSSSTSGGNTSSLMMDGDRECNKFFMASAASLLPAGAIPPTLWISSTRITDIIHGDGVDDDGKDDIGKKVSVDATSDAPAAFMLPISSVSPKKRIGTKCHDDGATSTTTMMMGVTTTATATASVNTMTETERNIPMEFETTSLSPSHSSPASGGDGTGVSRASQGQYDDDDNNRQTSKKWPIDLLSREKDEDITTAPPTFQTATAPPSPTVMESNAPESTNTSPINAAPTTPSPSQKPFVVGRLSLLPTSPSPLTTTGHGTAELEQDHDMTMEEYPNEEEGVERAPHKHESETAEQDDSPPWSYGHHRDFVSAILDMGIRQCSPAVIRDEMVSKKGGDGDTNLNGEKMKSHLQKFRQFQVKEVSEFMNEYDAFLVDLCQGYNSNDNAARLLIGGRAAAALTHEVLKGPSAGVTAQVGPTKSTVPKTVHATCGARYTVDEHGYPIAKVPKEDLTEKEMETPLGKALVFVHGALEQISSFLLAERAAAALAVAKAEAEQRALLEKDPVDAALCADVTFVNVGLDLDGMPLQEQTMIPLLTRDGSPQTKRTKLTRASTTKQHAERPPKARAKNTSKLAQCRTNGCRTKKLSNRPPSTPHAEESQEKNSIVQCSSSCVRSVSDIVLGERHSSPVNILADMRTNDKNMPNSPSLYPDVSGANSSTSQALSSVARRPSPFSIPASGMYRHTSSPILPPITGDEACKFALPPPTTRLSVNPLPIRNPIVTASDGDDKPMRTSRCFDGDDTSDGALENWEEEEAFLFLDDPTTPCDNDDDGHYRLQQQHTTNSITFLPDFTVVDEESIMM